MHSFGEAEEGHFVHSNKNQLVCEQGWIGLYEQATQTLGSDSSGLDAQHRRAQPLHRTGA